VIRVTWWILVILWLGGFLVGLGVALMPVATLIGVFAWLLLLAAIVGVVWMALTVVRDRRARRP
jgi:predicted lipid-binding transport protein (Tim44 family)